MSHLYIDYISFASPQHTLHVDRTSVASDWHGLMFASGEGRDQTAFCEDHVGGIENCRIWGHMLAMLAMLHMYSELKCENKQSMLRKCEILVK